MQNKNESQSGGIFSTYTLKVDCWTLGVMLYSLLSGTPSFSKDRKCGLNLRGRSPPPTTSSTRGLRRGDNEVMSGIKYIKVTSVYYKH